MTTLKGICDNASFPDTRLTLDQAAELRPDWRRTIAYWGNWQPVFESMFDVWRVGVKSLVVFNTEASGTDVGAVALHCDRLRQFLDQANHLPDAIEPGNELDMPGWNVPDSLIVEISARAAEVCAEYGVIALSASLLSGPEEGRFESIARQLVGSKVAAMCVHPYYVSVGGIPNTPEHRGNYPPDQRAGRWRYGALEEKADVCRDLGHGFPTWFSETGCTTIFDGIGEQAQADYTRALLAFEHPSIPVVMQFAIHDRCGSRFELEEEGKDWGIRDRDGNPKRAYAVWAQRDAHSGDSDSESDTGGVIVPASRYTVGTGVLEKMRERGDSPATDEIYHPIGAAESQYSETFGKSGTRYVYLFDGNKTLTFHPDQAA